MAEANETPQEQLLRLRASIDNIDAALVYMLAERFRCTKQVGQLKAVNDMPPSDPAREARQTERLRALALAQRPEEWVDAETGEVRAPTRAPAPLAAADDLPTDGARGRPAVVVLAPVLLPDSQAPWLGPWRSEGRVLAV